MIEWTDWQPLPEFPALAPDQLRELLDGGQAFRWTLESSTAIWRGAWANYTARIRQLPNGEIEVSVPHDAPQTLAALSHYLGCQADWAQRVDTLPWRSDEHLAACIAAFPQLRLLQQPFAETLLAFLCSATKQIPQIKVMCQNLATRLGSEIYPGIHALPSWEQVAAASESDLRQLALGFRAKNIKRTADFLAQNPSYLAQIEAAPYPEAKEALIQLPGVGEKIADCALLFGAGKLEAFPVDTWIIKVLEKRYQLADWNNAQLAQFGRTHFGQLAGFAQQFLFAYERQHAKTSKD